MSILKCGDNNGESCNRYFYNYEPIAGCGHFIHTYKCDGNPIPSFEGEPVKVAIDNDINIFADQIWQSLNIENKISLIVQYTNLKTKIYKRKIYNKNEG